MLHAVLFDLGLLLKSKIVSFTKPVVSYMSLVENLPTIKPTKGVGSTSAPNLTLFQGPPKYSLVACPPPRKTKGSSSNTKSNGHSSLPILNQMGTQFQMSKGSSSNTKSNENSSLPILNEMDTQVQISKGSSFNTKSNGDSVPNLKRKLQRY